MANTMNAKQQAMQKEQLARPKIEKPGPEPLPKPRPGPEQPKPRPGPEQPKPRPGPEPLPKPKIEKPGPVMPVQGAQKIAMAEIAAKQKPTVPAPEEPNLPPYRQNIDRPQPNLGKPPPMGANFSPQMLMPPMGGKPMSSTPMSSVSPNPMMMRRGGFVRNKPEAKFSSSGSVSKASSRGDGIAQRGKTKGRMC